MKTLYLAICAGALMLSYAFSPKQNPGTSTSEFTGYHLNVAQDTGMALLSYTIVPRNTNAPFSVFVDKVRQDDKVVGIIADGKKKDWGKNAVVYDIKLPKGTKIAEIAALEKGAKTCTVLTLRDNKKQELPIYHGSMEMDYVGIKYLIEKGYL
jgi:hypothetical protein